MPTPFLHGRDGRFTFSWRHLVYLLIALTLLAYIGYFLVYTQYAIALFQFPFDYDQGEGFELVDTVLFSQGQWPYRDNSQYPFYASNYPPFFHIMIVPLVWLFGPQYWTGRLVSYLATLVTAAAIGYAVRRQGGRRWLAVLSGLAYLASNYIYHVGPLFRQHLTMVMFETLAVVAVTVVIDREELDGRPRSRGLLAVMLLLLLAGYTKQLAYATVAAVFIFLFLRRPARAVRWAVPFAAVTGLIFLAINIATDGYWLLNTVTANLNPFLLDQAIGLYRQFLNLHTVLVVVAALIALYQFYLGRLSAYAIWFAVTAVNSVTAGKWGAGESYFATTIAATCILTGLALSALINWADEQGESPYLAAVTLVALLFLVQARLVFHLPTNNPVARTIASALGEPTAVAIAPQTSCSEPRPPEQIPYIDSAGVSLLGRPPTAADTAAGKRIAALVAAGKTAAFSEEAGFNLYVGRDVVTNPTQLRNLDLNQQLDLSQMVAMLDAQAFDTVVLRAQFYPPPILERIGQRYERVELIAMNGFVYCIMRPRPSVDDTS